MTRRCSHCSNKGHNLRTCPNRGVKLFGVRLTDGLIRKSASMGNLSHYTDSGSGSGSLHVGSNTPGSPGDTPDHGSAAVDGYASEDFVPGSSSSCRERKKGVPWTEDEHRMFLLGLQKLGKGDWRGIARNYVVSRTPTQVASHAQKYFIRQTNVFRRKRRTSLFDLIADESVEAPTLPREFLSLNYTEAEIQSENTMHEPLSIDEECESMNSINSNDGEPALEPENSQPCYPILYPAYFAPFCALPVPIWSGFNNGTEPNRESHEVVKPMAIHSKSPINVDELVGMSKLSLREGPTSLSLKLLDGSTRQSAFHANPSSTGSNMNSNGSPIHAV